MSTTLAAGMVSLREQPRYVLSMPARWLAGWKAWLEITPSLLRPKEAEA